jgi:hypothetical protein
MFLQSLKAQRELVNLIFITTAFWYNELLHTLKNNIDKNFDGVVDQLLWMVVKSHRDWLQKNCRNLK